MDDIAVCDDCFDVDDEQLGTVDKSSGRYAPDLVNVPGISTTVLVFCGDCCCCCWCCCCWCCCCDCDCCCGVDKEVDGDEVGNVKRWLNGTTVTRSRIDIGDLVMVLMQIPAELNMGTGPPCMGWIPDEIDGVCDGCGICEATSSRVVGGRSDRGY